MFLEFTTLRWFIRPFLRSEGSTQVCESLPDEAGNVDIDKCGHYVLAVKSVHNASVTRYGVGKILKEEKTSFQCAPNFKLDANTRLQTSDEQKVVYSDGKSLLRTFYLDLKCSLEAAGKEAAEGPHNGGEGGESDAVDLERIQTHGVLWTQEDRVGGKPPQPAGS